MADQSIALVVNDYDERALRAAETLRDWCAQHGVQVQACQQGCSADLVVALGGDGTILHAVHQLGSYDIPILGVKFGRLGFLSGAPANELIAAVEAALQGRVEIEQRAMLAVAAWSKEKCLGQFTAFNEALLGRNAQAAIVISRLVINGHLVYQQQGDGIIAATATGSTAYALSAGGPILSPSFRGIALVPLASHSLVSRPIVTAPKDVVRIELPDPSHAGVTLAIDGKAVLNNGESDHPLTHIDIALSTQSVSLVKTSSRLFFDTLASEFFGSND
ncbi:MAG: NAD(+)/NADH kinase [Coriobacteriia bacterium]|nr:NAD(+)/NADH kinase [Coriobacteriia bacterium]